MPHSASFFVSLIFIACTSVSASPANACSGTLYKWGAGVCAGTKSDTHFITGTAGKCFDRLLWSMDCSSVTYFQYSDCKGEKVVWENGKCTPGDVAVMAALSGGSSFETCSATVAFTASPSCSGTPTNTSISGLPNQCVDLSGSGSTVSMKMGVGCNQVYIYKDAACTQLRATQSTLNKCEAGTKWLVSGFCQINHGMATTCGSHSSTPAPAGAARTSAPLFLICLAVLAVSLKFLH
eukprot:TRINITY_DN16803_c0_g1_i1.p1 TRINITY_DN16803_c0_g1~~TRINITY_DN16803_c0_g1_i1.p1  ORF type:complete len:237 (-),score=25.13 TRINITY_DN16803_c0_g1_i1:81-791(-)